jgi:hypothetical protein
MNQFVFEGRLKTFLLALIGIGLLSLGLSYGMADDAYHSRFWSNLLHNSVFFTAISLLATFFIAVCITAYAGWHTVFKRIFEAFSMFLIPGIGLMVLIAITVYFHMNHLYHWADADAVDSDPILAGKSSFLNVNWYLFGTVIIGAIWIWFAHKMRNLSLAEDKSTPDSNFSIHRQLRFWGAIFLPVAGFTSCAMIWQWIMSVDAHWYSTLFAWYSLTSAFVSMIALTIIVLLYLKSRGYYEEVSDEHVHDLGKFLFAFSIFWTYLWFSQFMLIWYANIGEETVYFKERYERYPILFFSNIAVNFLVPFLILMRNSTKRKAGTMLFTAGVVLFGHWVDYFLMIKPGVFLTLEEAIQGVPAYKLERTMEFVNGFTLPGFLELGTFLGFLGFFLYVSFEILSRSALVPANDPYLKESLHHHV